MVPGLRLFCLLELKRPCENLRRPVRQKRRYAWTLRRQIAIASIGNPQLTFNPVDFYPKEASLLGVDTLRLSPGEAAEILKALLPGFKEGIFSPPAVEPVSLDEALSAYRAVMAGSSGKKFVIRLEEGHATR